MQFTFQGSLYRIEFQHQRPREWTAHEGHALRMLPKGQLYCDRCHIYLAGISPRVARILKQADRRRPVRFVADVQKRVLAEREYARNVNCSIQRREGDAWEVLYTGNSRLNVEAGDHYDREEGRLSALRNALPVADPTIPQRGLFRAAAMRCYRERPKGKNADGFTSKAGS
jgi:hypothetical protein